MIKIIHLADRRNISGSLITLCDLHFNLLSFGINNEFCIYCESPDVSLNYHDYIKRYICNKKSKQFNISFLQKEIVINADVIITTSELLSTIYPPNGIINRINCKLNCDFIIMLDTLGLWIAEQENRLDDIKELIKNFPKIYFFSSPANLKYNFFYKSIEYYHKLSSLRLNYIKEIYKVKIDDFFTTEIYSKSKQNPTFFKKELFNPHIYSKYQYERWFKRNNKYAENIGKMIFEFMWLKKPVTYSSRNKTFDDGLHYYLQQIGLDDNLNYHNIIIDKKILEDFVFMKETDILLNILRG